jgi:predicted transposase YdaD
VKTDTIFYQLFETFPRGFFELIEQPTSADAYTFTCVEIKQTAFRIDNLFLPVDRKLLMKLLGRK